MRVRPLAASVGAVIALALSAASAWAGLELIVIDKPFHARHLSGIVVDQSGAPISGALVAVCEPTSAQVRTATPAEKEWRLCDNQPEHTLASATTDRNGHFEFKQIGLRHTQYLHMSIDGFNPMQISVKWGLFARREPQVIMHVAT